MKHMVPPKACLFLEQQKCQKKAKWFIDILFKDFLDEVGHDKVCLVMHTDPKDGYGQDLHAIVNNLGLNKQQVLFSTATTPSDLAMLYNVADFQ